MTRLDRLARSTRDLLDIAERLKEAGAGLKSLAEPWADTTSPAGPMVKTIFAGIAEFERALIVQRTSSTDGDPIECVTHDDEILASRVGDDQTLALCLPPSGAAPVRPGPA